MTRISKISAVERAIWTGIWAVLGGMFMLFFLAWDLTARPTVRRPAPIVEYDIEPAALAVLLLAIWCAFAWYFGWGGETKPY